MRGEPRDPARAGHAVAVEEGHERRRHLGQPVVAGRAGAARHRAPAEPGAAGLTDPDHGGRVERAVIDHDHRVAGAER